MSTDGGLTWSWLGTKTVKGSSFSYEFTPNAQSVRFAFSLPYQEADLERFLARHKGSEHLAVPFMDKDGVEDGDQGKGRKPRDHGRDYEGKSLYPTVRTLRAFVPEWSAGRLIIAHDFHCPYIRENKIYQVGSSHENIWAEHSNLTEYFTANKGLQGTS